MQTVYIALQLPKQQNFCVVQTRIRISVLFSFMTEYLKNKLKAIN